MNKRILHLAIPNIVSNITIPLLSMADLAILGHMESEIYIGAIALGGIIFSMIYWSFSFLRMSTSGFAAQAYGARQLGESANVLFRSVSLSAGMGLLLIALQWPIAEIGFNLLSGGEEVTQLAREYYYIRIYAAPASLSLYVFYGWFIGMQNAKSPMLIAITINVLNILFNVMFVFGFGMRSDGVAWGTLLAQYSGFLLALFLLWRYYKKVVWRVNWKKTFRADLLLRFFRVNSDIFVRSLTVVFVLSFFTNESGRQGNTVLAVNTLLLQFFYLFSYFADGFAYAAEALVGKAYGARSMTDLKRTTKAVFRWGIAIGLGVSCIYFLFGKQIMHILTNNGEILQISNEYLFWVWLIPAFSFASFIWDGVYTGTTASRALRNTMLLSAGLLFFPTYFLFLGMWGNHALWLAMLLFMTARGVFQTILAKRVVFRFGIKAETANA